MIYRIQKALLALLLALISCGAMAQVSTKSFDHIKTGFALSGMHSNTRCESCHVNGVFKGTPRDCASCHVSGLRLAKANVVKPSNHFQTPLGCESCHTTVTFTGAKFDHLGVAPTACASCHNGAGYNRQAVRPHTDAGRLQHLPQDNRLGAGNWHGPLRNDGCDQLRKLPQRQFGYRQVGRAYQHHAELHQLPHHHGLEANELEPHPSARGQPVLHLPQW